MASGNKQLGAERGGDAWECAGEAWAYLKSGSDREASSGRLEGSACLFARVAREERLGPGGEEGSTLPTRACTCMHSDGAGRLVYGTPSG